MYNLKIIIAFLLVLLFSSLNAQPVDNQSTAQNTAPNKTAAVLPNLSEFAAAHSGVFTATNIEAQDLHRRLSSGERWYVLDAREEREYRVSHLKGARRVGYEDFSTEHIWMLRRTVPIVVYCAAGERSGILADYLLFSGFSNVYILSGAIIGWSNAQLPLYDARNLKTTQVHVLKKENNALLKKGRAVW